MFLRQMARSMIFNFIWISLEVDCFSNTLTTFLIFCSLEILSDDPTTMVTFDTKTTSKSVFHTLKRATPSAFVESKDQAQDATFYLATSQSVWFSAFGLALSLISYQPGTTWQIGDCNTMRNAFAANATLSNSQLPKNPRAITECVTFIQATIMLNYLIGVLLGYAWRLPWIWEEFRQLLLLQCGHWVFCAIQSSERQQRLERKRGALTFSPDTLRLATRYVLTLSSGSLLTERYEG